MPETVALFNALLTPLIAGIAVYIAYQQYRTNLKREQRENRQAKFECYRKLKIVFNNIEWEGQVSKSDYELFGEALAEADFLFPDELTEWLSGAYSSATQWVHFNESAEEHLKNTGQKDWEMLAEESWRKQRKEMNECVEELRDFHLELRDRFSKYISLG